MGHSCSILSKSKKPIVFPPNPNLNPIVIPDEEDKIQEENEKDFCEYEPNAIVINQLLKRKNCK